MPRYFIDTDDGEHFVADDHGYDLADAQAARDLAQTALGEMAHQTLPDGDQRTLRASVRENGGGIVYKATLVLDGRWTGL